MIGYVSYFKIFQEIEDRIYPHAKATDVKKKIDGHGTWRDVHQYTTANCECVNKT